MKEIKVTVKIEEILEFLREERDCKIEIDYDKNAEEYDAYVLPLEAAGFEDKINTQTLETYDYKEFKEEKEYIDWLIDCYNRPYETEDYSIKIDFEK